MKKTTEKAIVDYFREIAGLGVSEKDVAANVSTLVAVLEKN